ncbi:MAG: hypothetical protein KI791_01535 [Cyclobacteriaceae bacterium]|nr:hypothetical protein [Cyclobacteriaceae bacterium SS2]
MSLHAGIKLKYLLEGVSPWVQKDDLVVLSAVLSNFESRGDQTSLMLLNAYSYLSDSMIGNDYLLWLKVKVNYIQKKINRILVQSFFQLFFETIDLNQVERVYEHRNFNEWGDIVLPAIPNRKIEIQGTLKSGDLLPYNRKLLSAFTRDLQGKGTRLVIACPPLYEPAISDLGLVHKLFGQLGEIPGLEVISQPEDYVLDESLFFDTSNHLNSKGKVIRTQQLIADLERYLSAISR